MPAGASAQAASSPCPSHAPAPSPATRAPPTRHSTSTIRGRPSTLDLHYDYDKGTVEYHSVGHTFFLGRRRQVDDVLKLPTDRPLDDLLSAELNFAAEKLDRDPDGTYRTYIVR